MGAATVLSLGPFHLAPPHSRPCCRPSSVTVGPFEGPFPLGNGLKEAHGSCWCRPSASPGKLSPQSRLARRVRSSRLTGPKALRSAPHELPSALYLHRQAAVPGHAHLAWGLALPLPQPSSEAARPLASPCPPGPLLLFSVEVLPGSRAASGKKTFANCLAFFSPS